jgi:hypothetical protein
MDNSYFEKIKLPEQPKEQQTADETEPAWPSHEEFAPVLERIINEINKVQTGTSELSNYAITFSTGIGNNSAPIMEVFRRFRAEPTKDNMVSFLTIVENDINLNCRREFTRWLNAIIKRDI